METEPGAAERIGVDGEVKDEFKVRSGVVDSCAGQMRPMLRQAVWTEVAGQSLAGHLMGRARTNLLLLVTSIWSSKKVDNLSLQQQTSRSEKF